MCTKKFLTAASYPWPLGSLCDFTVFTYEVTVYNLGYFYLNFGVAWSVTLHLYLVADFAPCVEHTE